MKYIYGFAADPITKAHLEIIKTIHKRIKKNDEMFVLVSNNDEKNYKTPIEHRITMVRDLIENKFTKNVPTILQQNKRTLSFITELFGYEDHDITICIGEDQWNDLKNGKWQQSKILLKNYNFIIVCRTTTEIDVSNYNAELITVDGCNDISSTKVREILYYDPETHYNDVSKYIAHQTFRYIKENELYYQHSPNYQNDEKEFLKEYDKKKIENNWGEPSVTTDTIAYNGNKILLIRRKNYPYRWCWCLPGGFMNKTDLDLNYGAARELKEETGLDLNPNDFKQIKAYGHNFDPRLKIVDVAFAVRVNVKDMKKIAGDDDALEAKWFDLEDLPRLGFHHKQIIDDWLEL